MAALIVVLCTIACVLITSLLWTTVSLWWKSRALTEAMASQGIRGPAPMFMGGNFREMFKLRTAAEERGLKKITHDIVSHVLPYYECWSKLYGKSFLMWWVSEPRVMVTDLDMIKEVLFDKSGRFSKSAGQQKFLSDLIGRGLVVVDGEEWAFHRRILNPAFHLDRVKGMVPTMAVCVKEMLNKWDQLLEKKGVAEIEMSQEFTVLTADVISRTAFGSSYEQGHKVFELLQLLGKFLFTRASMTWITGIRYFPISINFQIWKLQKELNLTLEQLVKERHAAPNKGSTMPYGSDLLGMMLAEWDGAKKEHGFGIKEITEECKTFYLAGHETTSALLTWTMFLLAVHPEWQKRARDEVVEICGRSSQPDAEAPNKLKLVGMILNESLRLYPPAVFMARISNRDTQLGGNLKLPEGMGVMIPVVAIHHDTQVWGADANEFNPERFGDGVAKACKHPFAFMPFSQGPRVCIGQMFAMMEAKVALAMILQTFSFKISPNYAHNPVVRVIMRPKDGMPLLVQRL